METKKTTTKKVTAKKTKTNCTETNSTKTNSNRKNHKKTLICIADIANKGKTYTAGRVIYLLSRLNGAAIVFQTNITTIFNINNQNIGVDTKGDPYKNPRTNFPARINFLGAFPCDAIVCTSRSSGATINAAKATARRYSMLFIKTTTYQPDDPAFENIMNDYKAEDIMTMLRRRNHI